MNPSPYYYAEPLESEPFEWHFTIRGPNATQFEGGLYHGVITLPSSYPFRPPYIVFLTPSGRFQVKEKICLTFTNYHPEYWQPAWTIRNILQALVSFMPVDEDNMSIGAMQGSKDERAILARKSAEWGCEQCGASNSNIAKEHILPLTAENAEAEDAKLAKAAAGNQEFASLLKFAPAKQLA